MGDEFTPDDIPLPDTIDTKTLTRYMRVILLFGAMRRSASEAQITRLREEVLPLMHDVDVPLREVVLHALRIMGPSWLPDEETVAWMRALSDDH